MEGVPPVEDAATGHPVIIASHMELEEFSSVDAEKIEDLIDTVYTAASKLV